MAVQPPPITGDPEQDSFNQQVADAINFMPLGNVITEERIIASSVAGTRGAAGADGLNRAGLYLFQRTGINEVNGLTAPDRLPDDFTLQYNYSNATLRGRDAIGGFTDRANAGYESYMERVRLAMTPEFNTENLLSVAMLTEGDGASLEVRATGTNTPAELTDLSTTGGVVNTFDISNDYKIDLREHGRLLNHRITDVRGTVGWSVSGLQFDIGSGGTR